MKLQSRGTWLDEYLEYTKCSESPTIFHKWAGISVISSVLGRKVWWDLGYSDVYPNLFVVLVARSAGLRKTAACEIAVDLLYNLPVDLKIIADKLTNEYLLKTMGLMNEKDGRDADVFVYAEELSVFIGPNALSSGLIASLTKLYNCPNYFPYGTKTSGSYVLVNSCMNMLGASTPEWLRLCMPSESLGGGFTGRIVFVTALEKERSISHPKKIMPDKEHMNEQRSRLINDLIKFYDLNGEFVMSEGAERFYDEWYERRDEQQINDPRLESYYERRHTTLVKVAMVLAVNRGSEYIIEDIDLRQALDMLRGIELNMIHAYEGITFSDSTKHIDRLLRQINMKGQIGHSELLKRNSFHMNAEEFDRVIKTLKGAESIEEILVGKKRFYKSKDGGTDEKTLR